MGFSSSPNPWGFAGCGNSTVFKNVRLQSNLTQEQGSREAVGSLSLEILAACLDKALSCCSPFKAESYPVGSRHWTRDSRDLCGVCIITSTRDFHAVSQTSATDKQKPSARTTEQIQAREYSTSSFCLSQAEVSSSRCSVLCTVFPQGSQSQLQHTALILCPLPKQE